MPERTAALRPSHDLDGCSGAELELQLPDAGAEPLFGQAPERGRMGVLVMQGGAGARSVAGGLLKQSPIGELVSRLDQLPDRDALLVSGRHGHVSRFPDRSASSTLATET